MRRVRARDKTCRFPQCPCRKLNLRTEVAHSSHRGMGGNPAGDRTTTAGLVLLCLDRHQGRTSLHSGDIQWTSVTSAGADGPIEWHMLYEGRWVRLATEAFRGVVVEAAITDEAMALLNTLRVQMIGDHR